MLFSRRVWLMQLALGPSFWIDTQAYAANNAATMDFRDPDFALRMRIVNDDVMGGRSSSHFVIDPEGVIMHSTINNLPVGRNVDETLRVLQAFQHVQANPDEVCPANWTPGEKTMNPDPVKSKDFFAAVN